MAIIISVEENVKELVAGIPESITIIVDQTCNVYFTLDGSSPDPSGNSLDTHILEPDAGNALRGTILLPTDQEILTLNILAIGADVSNTGTFFRRYEVKNVAGATLRGKRITYDEPNQVHPDGYINYNSPNIADNGQLIWADGYTDGYSQYTPVSNDGFGYIDAYGTSYSGEQVEVPVPTGTVEGYGGASIDDVIAYSHLSYNELFNQTQRSTRAPVYENNGGVNFPVENINWDARSPDVHNIPTFGAGESAGTVVPVEQFIALEDYDDQPEQNILIFNGKTMFNPRAAYIIMDGRKDGYMNGYKIEPGDVHIINKPYQSIRYKTTREDLGMMYRNPNPIISGSMLIPIVNYAKNEIVYTYYDSHDNRRISSLQSFTPPTYSVVAQRNGVVLGWVFTWVWGRSSYL